MKNKTINNKVGFLILYWLPVIIWALIIFSFSNSPTHAVSAVHWQDFIIKKTIHMVEYGIFTLLLFRAYYKSGVNTRYAFLLSFLTAFFYGVTDEFHQSFTPTREPTIRDVLFDGAGSLVVIYFISNLLPNMPEGIKILARRLDLL